MPIDVRWRDSPPPILRTLSTYCLDVYLSYLVLNNLHRNLLMPWHSPIYKVVNVASWPSLVVYHLVLQSKSLYIFLFFNIANVCRTCGSLCQRFSVFCIYLISAWICWNLTKIDKNWQKLTKIDKNWQKMIKLDRNWQRSRSFPKIDICIWQTW